MNLPNAASAVIPQKKLHNYLLSETHPTGRFKAKFFRQLGFTSDNEELLEKALLTIAQTEDVTESIESPFGMKYIIDGYLPAPNKEKVKIRTIWIIESNQKYPGFVTAYPV